MFHAPARPFAEGVIRPVPPVGLEDLDAVADVAMRAAVRGPPNGAELAQENVHAVGLLEVDEISERYGTTPLEYDEWVEMLQKAGVKEIITEFEEWSKPEMFYKIRKDRDVKDFSKIYTPKELGFTIKRITEEFGQEGVKTALENQKVFVDSVLSGKIGYCLFKGKK